MHHGGQQCSKHGRVHKTDSGGRSLVCSPKMMNCRQREQRLCLICFKIERLQETLDWNTEAVAEAMLLDASTWLTTCMPYVTKGKLRTCLRALNYQEPLECARRQFVGALGDCRPPRAHAGDLQDQENLCKHFGVLIICEALGQHMT